MQPISPVTVDQLLDSVKEILQKFEIYIGGAWIDLTSLEGVNYLKSVNAAMGGAGLRASAKAGSWSATFRNDGNIFHHDHPTSPYKDYFQVGRLIRISLGGNFGGSTVYWRRMLGYMDQPQFDSARQQFTVSGTDLLQRLTDCILPAKGWGEEAVFSTVATAEVLGSELYGHGDAVRILNEYNGMSDWVAENPAYLTVEEEGGGGSTYVAQLYKTEGVYWHDCYIDGIESVIQGHLYKVTVKYRIAAGDEESSEFEMKIYESGSTTNLMGGVNGLKSWDWTTATFYFTATATGNVRIRVRASDISAVPCTVQWDQVSIKEVTGHTNTSYSLPAECNGPYSVTLAGEPIYFDDPAEKYGWLYSESSRILSFVDGVTLPAGAELRVSYYTTQTVENVVADLLVEARYFADRASALAAMNYTPTGVSIPRVWFNANTTGLAAVQKLCERVNYRFWPNYAGILCFQPTPTVGTPDFTFTNPKQIATSESYKDLKEIRNKVLIEGIEQGMFKTGEDKQNSRLKGSAADEDSIQAYGEHTLSFSNHLFQDQPSLDDMCATLLALYKDPKRYYRVPVAHNAVPLDAGDTMTCPVKLDDSLIVTKTGLIRDISISDGRVTFTLECGDEPPGMLAHGLLDSAFHIDTETADPVRGDLVRASGTEPAPAAAPGTNEHALLSEMHDDTTPAAPLAADLLMAEGDPVTWKRMPSGAEGQVFEMGATLPKWGRKITSSDDPPNPEDGSDGDIWLEY